MTAQTDTFLTWKDCNALNAMSPAARVLELATSAVLTALLTTSWIMGSARRAALMKNLKIPPWISVFSQTLLPVTLLVSPARLTHLSVFLAIRKTKTTKFWMHQLDSVSLRTSHSAMVRVVNDFTLTKRALSAPSAMVSAKLAKIWSESARPAGTSK